MGYTTIFQGEFLLDKPLTTTQKDYLQRFSETRRMKRNAELLINAPDPLREAVGLPIGVEGEYFVGSLEDAGQDIFSPSVINQSEPPQTQPGLWCKWTVSAEGTKVIWNEEEKFYEYLVWLSYLLDHFLKPWGYIVNGQCEWQGQNSEDQGIIWLTNNIIEARRLL